jgi:hypothetical protein
MDSNIWILDKVVYEADSGDIQQQLLVSFITRLEN